MQEDVNLYEHLTLADADNEKWIEFGNKFEGKSLKDNWIPLKLKLIEHGGKLKKGDMPYLSPGVPILSIKAINALNEYLVKNTEILPIDFSDADYKLINVINLLDGIDYKKSVVEYYSDKKRIMAFDKYSFILEKVENQHIFKILEQPRADVFVSDEFRNKVIESDLKGFKFVEVWDSKE